jgi:hypothetical protein
MDMAAWKVNEWMPKQKCKGKSIVVNAYILP